MLPLHLLVKLRLPITLFVLCEKLSWSLPYIEFYITKLISLRSKLSKDLENFEFNGRRVLVKLDEIQDKEGLVIYYFIIDLRKVPFRLFPNKLNYHLSESFRRIGSLPIRIRVR